MNRFTVTVAIFGVLTAHNLQILGSPSRSSDSQGTFSGIYSAISSILNRPKSFSAALLPSGEEPIDRRHSPGPASDRHDQLLESGGSSPPSFMTIFNDRSSSNGPKAGKRKQVVKLDDTDFEPITLSDVGPFKRSAQLDLPGYNYPVPEKQLLLPEDNIRDMEIILPAELADVDFDQMKGKLVLRSDKKTLKGEAALKAIANFLDSDPKITSERKLSESPSNRFVSFTTPRTVTVSPLTLSSTGGTIRLIQPIHILSSTTPSPTVTAANKRIRPSKRPRPSFPSSSAILSSSRLTSSPSLSSFSNNNNRNNNNDNNNNNLPSSSRSSSSRGALTFVDNGLVAVLGRQVAAGSGKPVEGFPNGLPDLTPLGVRITLENMLGPNGELIMNPIPGEAGVDYPVYSSVPDTGFDCNAQDFPGIYSDTGAQCQVFHMCQPNGESTAFLCPNGTMFNQQYFICDWWYNIDCADQPSFYSLNQFIYETPEEDGKNCKTLFCIND